MPFYSLLVIEAHSQP
ncbi:hypothetical protein LINPERPRIM_LOCUS4008 [Linum perenne]